MNVRLIPAEDMLREEITSIPGHEEYLPPEVFKDVRSYNTGSDIFSLGVIMIEVATHQPPRPLQSLKLTELQRRESDLLLVPKDSSGLLDVIHQCIRDQCVERPSAIELCSSLKGLKKSLQYGMSPASGGKQVKKSHLSNNLVCICNVLLLYIQ